MWREPQEHTKHAEVHGTYRHHRATKAKPGTSLAAAVTGYRSCTKYIGTRRWTSGTYFAASGEALNKRPVANTALQLRRHSIPAE
jgi:hypothetical protein